MEALSPLLADGMETLVEALARAAHAQPPLVLVCDPELVRRRAHDLVATSNEFLAASWHNAAAGNATPIDLGAVPTGPSRRSATRPGRSTCPGGPPVRSGWPRPCPMRTPRARRRSPASPEAPEDAWASRWPTPGVPRRRPGPHGRPARRAGGWAPRRGRHRRRRVRPATCRAADRGRRGRPGGARRHALAAGRRCRDRHHGPARRGIDAPRAGLLVVTESDIRGQKGSTRDRSRMPSRRRNTVDPLQLTAGDFVVHEQHGVGRYVEMTQRTVGGATREYLVLEYAPGQARPAAGPALRAHRPARPGHPLRRRRGAQRASPGRLGLAAGQDTRARGRSARSPAS